MKGKRFFFLLFQNLWTTQFKRKVNTPEKAKRKNAVNCGHFILPPLPKGNAQLWWNKQFIFERKRLTAPIAKNTL